MKSEGKNRIEVILKDVRFFESFFGEICKKLWMILVAVTIVYFSIKNVVNYYVNINNTILKKWRFKKEKPLIFS